MSASRTFGRRRFLKGLACLSLGSPAYVLALPRRSWAATADPYRETRLMMGTWAHLTIFGARPERARQAAEEALAEMERVERLMSVHRQFSQLSRVNRLAGSESLAVDARLLEVLEAGLRWSARTGGKFDVTTLPLLRAWGFREESGSAAETIEAARELVDYRALRIDGDRVGLERAGMGIDLGGIAKGYAVDRAIGLLRDRWGVRAAIVEAGGDLYALGRPPDAAGWRIGLAHPLREGDFCATFELADAAVATSGARRKRIQRDGRAYGDLIDPRTGEPVEAFLSLTAMAPTAMEADAASTTLFVQGRTAGGAPPAQIASLATLPEGSEGLSFAASPGFPDFDPW